eukprot:scaffold199768_cov39-Prasinocladus_malaysianus.AAC.1
MASEYSHVLYKRQSPWIRENATGQRPIVWDWVNTYTSVSIRRSMRPHLWHAALPDSGTAEVTAEAAALTAAWRTVFAATNTVGAP